MKLNHGNVGSLIFLKKITIKGTVLKKSLLALVVTSIVGCSSDSTNEEVEKYTVSTNATPGVSISPTSVTVNEGSTASFTVELDDHYQIDTIGGCDGLLSGSTYTTSTVSAACEVTVSATLMDYNLNVITNEGGSSSLTNSVETALSSVSFTLTPDEGYFLSSAEGCGGTLTENTFTIDSMISDCDVNVVFATNDGKAPEVSIVYPISDVAQSVYFDPTIRGIAKDNDGIKSITINGDEVVFTNVDDLSEFPKSVAWEFQVSKNSDHSLVVSTVDIAGNKNDAAASVSIVSQSTENLGLGAGEDLGNIRKASLDEENDKLFVATFRNENPSQILEIDLSSAQKTVVADLTQLVDMYDPLGFQYDAVNEIFYFSKQGYLYSYTLGSEAATTILNSSIVGSSGFVLNENSTTAFMFDNNSGNLVAVNLSTSDVTTISSSTKGTGPELSYVSALAYNASAGQLYAASQQNGNVLSIDVETGNRAVVFDSCGNVNLSEASGFTDLHYSAYSNSLYTADTNLLVHDLNAGECREEPGGSASLVIETEDKGFFYLTLYELLQVDNKTNSWLKIAN